MLDLTNFFLVFVRAGAMLVVFPVFSASNVPVQVRIGLGAMTAFLISPLLPPIPITSLSIWVLFRLLFIETSIGLLLGFVCRIVFFALEFAGGIAATEMGLSMAASYNPAAGTSMGAPAQLLYWLAVMLFLSLDLHQWMLVAFQRSYEILPAGQIHLTEALLKDVLQRTSDIFRIGVILVAPIMAVSFVVTLVYATLSRAVPQMNVFSDSYAVRTMVGLSVFGLTCSLMAQNIENYLRRIPEDMLRVAQLLGHG